MVLLRICIFWILYIHIQLELSNNFYKQRETYEWNEYHIPFAIYTGRGLLELNIEQIVKDPHDEVVLYCAGGKRSILAAEALTRMGYSNVKSLVNGIGGWRASDYPVYQNINMYSDRIKDY